MKNRNRKLRDVHVNNETWKWYVSDKSVIIFAPNKARCEVETKQFLIATAQYPAQQWDAMDGSEQAVSPAKVKRYILNQLLVKPENVKPINKVDYGKASDLMIKLRTLLRSYGMHLETYSPEWDLKARDKDGNRFYVSIADDGMPFISSGYDKDYNILK